MQKLLDFPVFLVDYDVGAVAEYLIETIDKVHEACYLLVVDGNVSACLVSYAHVVPLCDEPLDGSSHGDDVVVGMWREDEHPLGIWCRPLWAIGVVSAGLATRPSSDGVLQVVENLDVGIVRRAVECKQLREPVLVVVLVGELQDRLPCELAQPYECRTHQLVCPLA